MKTRSLGLLATSIFSLAAAAVAQGTTARALERLAESQWTLETARHLLFRAGFGGTPEEAVALHAKGLQGAVDWLVDYEKQPDAVGQIVLEPTTKPDPKTLVGLTEEERKKKAGEVRRQDAQKIPAIVSWWYERMLLTERPLEEKMTLFWHGHFTSSYQDVRNAYHMWLQNELLRKHATGNFRALVHEISRDPAMLEYLDNNRNNRRAPNENYARELMELFTLGVGNYTEKDIKEAARAFTGWTFRDSRFVFNRGAHDPGPKTFLGKTGDFGGDEIIDIILEQEAAPRYLASRLLAFFVHPEPKREAVEELAALIRSTDYEIKPALRALFASKLFHDPAHRGNQVKSPVMLSVSMARQLGMKDPPVRFLATASAGLGQSLLFPPNVQGWEGGTAWVTTSNLLNRYNFAKAMVEGAPGAPGARGGLGRDAGGKLLGQLAGKEGEQARQDRPGAKVRELLQRRAPLATSPLKDLVPKDATPQQVVDVFAKRFLLVPLTVEKRNALVEFLEGKDGSKPLELGGRAAETKLRSLLHLIMSTPEFQVC